MIFSDKTVQMLDINIAPSSKQVRYLESLDKYFKETKVWTAVQKNKNNHKYKTSF